MERPLDIAQDGELFPREELLDAVAGADWRDLPVRLVAWLAVALGGALALAGLPEQFDLLEGPTTVAASGDGLAAHPLHLVARAIGGAGIGIEAALFGLSALGVGAAFLAVGAALRAFGIGGRTAFATALLTCGSLAVISSGRLPSTYSFGVAASALLMAAIAAPSDGAARGYGTRVALAWLLASWVSPAAALLLPACALAITGRAGEERAAGLAPLWIAALVALPVAALACGAAGAHEVQLAGARHFGGLLGLMAVALSATRRDPEESAAPRWLHLWLRTGIALEIVASLPLDGMLLVGGAPSALAAHIPPATFLVPALAAFAADALVRRRRASDAVVLLAVGAIGQALPFGYWYALDADEGTALHDGRGELAPGDVALVAPDAYADVAYLLARRHGVPVIDPDSEEGVQAAADAKRALSVGEDHPLATHRLSPSTGSVRPIRR